MCANVTLPAKLVLGSDPSDFRRVRACRSIMNRETSVEVILYMAESVCGNSQRREDVHLQNEPDAAHVAKTALADLCSRPINVLRRVKDGQ